MTPTLRKLLVLFLLIVGLDFWIRVCRAEYGHGPEPLVLAGVLAVTLIPPVRRKIWSATELIRQPSLRARTITALGIALVATLYLFYTHHRQHTELLLKFHDEFSYMIQMRMLAQGKLWMHGWPGHVSDFFDSFMIFVDPKYASIYFPGTALLYVPTIWLHLPYWVPTVFVAGACVGLTYWVIAEMTDGLVGFIAALMVVATINFRRLAVMLLSQTPMLFFGLLTLAAYFQWRRKRSGGWAVAVGVFAAWGGITRPVDAICYVLPIGVAMLLDLRSASLRQWMKTVAWVVAGALPFLALQAVQNVGITGHLTEFPEGYYAAEYYPGPMLGVSAPDLSKIKPPTLLEKRIYLKHFVMPSYRAVGWAAAWNRWWDDRAQYQVIGLLPDPLLIIFFPVAIAGVFERRRWMMLVTVLLFVGIYALYRFDLAHYTLVIMPLVAGLILIGLDEVTSLWPKHREAVWVPMLACVAALSVMNLPEVRRSIRDDFDYHVMQEVEQTVESAPRKPAVVLIPFNDKGWTPHMEPVYNFQTAWPDDAAIVRAHDLGPERNRELFRYYADRQPNRFFYRYLPTSNKLVPLGTARELAEHGEPSSTTRP